MDPSRKRRIRFVVALSAAVLLAGALMYTSFSASTEAREPSQLARPSRRARPFQLTAPSSRATRSKGDTTYFRVRDRKGNASVPVTYSGQLPDPFRADREIVVDVQKEGNVYVGQKGSLVTKCPSKFTADTDPDLTCSSRAKPA